mgnify:CR=1 FL=1
MLACDLESEISQAWSLNRFPTDSGSGTFGVGSVEGPHPIFVVHASNQNDKIHKGISPTFSAFSEHRTETCLQKQKSFEMPSTWFCENQKSCGHTHNKLSIHHYIITTNATATARQFGPPLKPESIKRSFWIAVTCFLKPAYPSLDCLHLFRYRIVG